MNVSGLLFITKEWYWYLRMHGLVRFMLPFYKTASYQNILLKFRHNLITKEFWYTTDVLLYVVKNSPLF